MEAYFGYVETVQDALLVVEAARSGLLPRAVHRLTEAERRAVRSGSVYVWDESETSMRRWTDGRAWSPSRVSGCFLNYREYEDRNRNAGLTGPFGAWPAAGYTPSISWVPVDSDDIKSNAYVLRNTSRTRHGRTSPSNNNGGSGNIGSRTRPHLVYKSGGLIKRTISVTVSENRKLHLISYFTKRDVLEGRLQCPRNDPALTALAIPGELYPDMIVVANQDQDGEERGSTSPEPSDSPTAQRRTRPTTPDLRFAAAVGSEPAAEQLQAPLCAVAVAAATQSGPSTTCADRRALQQRVNVSAPTPSRLSIYTAQHRSPDASPEAAYTMMPCLYSPWQPLPRPYPTPLTAALLPSPAQTHPPPPHYFVPTPSVSPDPTLFRASTLSVACGLPGRKQLALTDLLSTGQPDTPTASAPIYCPSTPPFPPVFNDRRLPPLSVSGQGLLPHAQHQLTPNQCGEDRRQLDALQSHLLL